MSLVQARRGDGEIGYIIDTLVSADGIGSHPHTLALLSSGVSHAGRTLHDFADAAHYLCLLHGRFPGVIDHAAGRSTEDAARQWVLRAADAFADERAFITQLSVALGPVPSTAGQNNCDTAVLQQRHALDMLAQSDRRGCAIGAAITLALEWFAVRRLLDTAALRVGIEPSPCRLPDREATRAVIDGIGTDEAICRALQFGCRQLLSQHRGLWDLLQARTQVRAG